MSAGTTRGRSCSCGGYGCENCANPADYCRGYEPAFDRPELAAPADDEARFWADLRQRIAEALYGHDQPERDWQQALSEERRRYLRLAAAVLPVLPDRSGAVGSQLYAAVHGLTPPTAPAARSAAV